jgi:hypothetical protein
MFDLASPSADRFEGDQSLRITAAKELLPGTAVIAQERLGQSNTAISEARRRLVAMLERREQPLAAGSCRRPAIDHERARCRQLRGL